MKSLFIENQKLGRPINIIYSSHRGELQNLCKLELFYLVVVKITGVDITILPVLRYVAKLVSSFRMHATL
jgi:hypothetical protein